MNSTITFEEFLEAAKEFIQKSNQISDGWILKQDKIDVIKTYLRKETFIHYEEDEICNLLKVEYVIFYNLSYGVPSFSFNIWNSSGTLLSLEGIRKMSFIQ